MKAVFFSIKRARNRVKPQYFSKGKTIRDFDLKFFIRKYGVSVFLASVLIMGMIIGSIYAQSAGERLYNGLDFLFTTNLQVRLSQGFLQTFCACFASNFIFIAIMFLLGITPWGIPLIPLICAFKGFGAGLSGGFLVESHGIAGFFFYFTVLLSGIFIFCMTLICMGNLAFYNSKRIFKVLFLNSDKEILLKSSMFLYMQRCLTFLIISLGCAVLDSVLWCLVAPLFGFN